ncbi:glycosyltransferase family 2 protein [Chryseobacterium balustinum]|uniref:Chondroitin polymerase n=1 Tax=Chryseobacterium balustinum TaxID=246 RepID=A0AAX2IGN2_9FLAO|nr:glycosyltransferase family 2 protein [Chryseobacterium balustinum]AZB31715.1 glycosyltransferase family 2 protein [Chryseobacterium balustinum]SKB84323.1 Glycosyltransferase involved in cell wall bisynthesis [Chryseobacterium balustinum]SQA86917.1 Chondroitin polymerase [Chryseobacterium balustinum]
MTKISVALCTYNGEKYIREQIDSILEQSLKVDEIVVCDDGSTDKTLSILSEYENKFPNIFKIHLNEKNLRSVKNFEKAISLCSGEIIFLSDQDDVWENNKVKIFSDFFEDNQNVDVICSNGFIIDENSLQQNLYTVWDVPNFLSENKKEIDYFKIFATIGNFATGASMAIRKSFINKVLPFPTVEGLHHDEWIALVSSEQKNFAFINEKLFSYRIHSEQQVGGICYSKDEVSKEKLISRFDYDKAPKTFRDFKIKLRTLNDKERKFTVYLEKDSNENAKRFLKEVQNEKLALYQKLKSERFALFLFFKYFYR